MKNSKKWVKNRHKIVLGLLKPFFYLSMKSKYHFKIDKYKFNKDENAIILSNHQTESDQFLISLMFNKPIYYVATDTMYSSKLVSKLINYLAAPIMKEKGVADFSTIKNLISVSKEKGVICLFPEGNRSYGEFQFNIDEATVKLLRKLNMNIIFINIIGGFGISPRFANKKRKGQLEIKIIEKIENKELDNYSDEQLLEKIKNNLRVFDSETNKTFDSNKRAEYLERMLFVCPKCNSMNSIYSNKNHIYCHNCDLKVEYTNKLTLESIDPNFKFKKLVDWYNFQKQYLRDLNINDNELLFNDENVKLLKVLPNYNRKLICKGNMKLYKDKLVFNDEICFNVNDILIASPVAGTKISINIGTNKYVIIGDKKFNPLKYTLMFNKLDTKMKNIDKYYSLD